MVAFTYVPRVTQLDSVQLDEELIDLLKNQLLEITKFTSPGTLGPFAPELELALRSAVFRYSLFENGSTFGQRTLSLKYDENNLSRGKLYWFYFYTVVLKYAKDRLILSHTSNRRAQAFLLALERFQVIGDFFNLIRFLRTGKNATLIDYILNLHTVSEKAFRNQFTDFSWTRELLWHSFVELFGVLAPYINSRKVRRVVREKTISLFKKNVQPVQSAFMNHIPVIKESTKCAECNGNPIIPHYMGCDHIFCQYCLQSHKLENPHYKCPKCNFFSSAVMRVPSG